MERAREDLARSEVTTERLRIAWIAAQGLPGQTMFTFPAWHVGAAGLATALLGVAASVPPAVRAAKVEVLAAVQEA